MSHFAERHFRKLVVTIWLMMAMFFAFMGRDAIAAMKLGDPDDALRIVQVRDWLAGQSWWDVTQYRMNLPDGGPMHWSRLVDLPIAAAILLFRPWFGQAGAEQAAAAIIPLLTFGVVLGFYSMALRRLWGATTAVLGAATLALILPVTAQLLPMRIDHHGWQVVLFCAALWALFDPRQRLWSAVLVGLSMALWMEISVEALPFALLFLGLFALRWLWPTSAERDGGLQFLSAASSFTAGLFALFASTEKWGVTPDYCDSLSPFHLYSALAVTIVLAAAMLSMRRRLLPSGLLPKLVLCAVAGLSGGLSLLAVAPQCAGDAFATLDPLVRSYWFERVAEGLPLWDLPLQFTAQPIACFVAGLLAFVWLWRSDKSQPTDVKIMLTLLFAGCVVVGSMVSRTFLYAMLVGHVVIAPMAVALFNEVNSRKGLVTRLGLRIIPVAMLMSAIIGQNLWAMKTAAAAKANPTAEARKQAFYKQARACQSPESMRLLNKQVPSHFLAPLDSSPAILLFTQHRVVATGHHRNAQAMADVIRAFTGSDSTARQIVTRRSIDLVLTCDGSSELANYRDRHPEGFAAQLYEGRIPDWLERQPDIGPFHIYRVKR